MCETFWIKKVFFFPFLSEIEIWNRFEENGQFDRTQSSLKYKELRKKDGSTFSARVQFSKTDIGVYICVNIKCVEFKSQLLHVRNSENNQNKKNSQNRKENKSKNTINLKKKSLSKK